MPALKGHPKQGGRVKGTPNKFNADIKSMIVTALQMVGGEHYLAEKAQTHPAAFLALVGRVLPLQIADSQGAPISIDIRWAPALIEGSAEAPESLVEADRAICADSTASSERDDARDSTELSDRDVKSDGNARTDRTDYRNVQKDRAA